MNDIVVDASFVGLINLPDELPAQAATALALELSAWRLHVPSHRHLEVANMLVKAERQHRITREGRSLALAQFARLPVNVDRSTPDHVWEDVLPLADERKLTVYDAAYLELALRIGAALASHDARLIAVARELGVALLTAPE